MLNRCTQLKGVEKEKNTGGRHQQWRNYGSQTKPPSARLHSSIVETVS